MSWKILPGKPARFLIPPLSPGARESMSDWKKTFNFTIPGIIALLVMFYTMYHMLTWLHMP